MLRSNCRSAAKLTNGLGCGAIPEKGRQAALEDTERIIELLDGADMVFVTAGMGGGTGTGAAPIMASLATELGALTVGVVTKPFNFEGKKRQLHAEEGIHELKDVVDTLITIPNERLLAAMGPEALLEDSFRYADDVLCQAVQGISDIITMPGIVNVDFADVRTIMAGKGMALMGTGMAEGQNRAVEAAQRAISSPLLEETSIRGAEGYPDQHHSSARQSSTCTRWMPRPKSLKRSRAQKIRFSGPYMTKKWATASK